MAFNRYICQNHFTPEDYAMILSPFKKKLKKDSLPRNFLEAKKTKSPKQMKIIKPKGIEISQDALDNTSPTISSQEHSEENASFTPPLKKIKHFLSKVGIYIDIVNNYKM